MKRCNRIAWAAMALAFPITALADITSTATLNSGQSFSFDSGTTVSSGDIGFTGSSITFEGSAIGLYLFVLGSTDYDAINASEIGALKKAGSTTPISLGQLTVGAVFAVLTNAGNVGKAMVTASSSGFISFKFTTYGATGGGGGGGGPTISRVTNNSSDIPAGFPNSGISQGALFKVVGSNLADDGDANLHDSSAAGGLPTLLNNAKITVTVGNTTVTVALYYATPTQIDGVMPANMPTGSGTLTVTHNGTASAAFAILVVTAAPGITTYNNGTAVAQDVARPGDPYGGLVTFLKSAAPGGTIIIWGSGFGATSDSDTAYTNSPHQTTVSYTIYIGGVQASIGYAGRSVYPGVSVFGVTVPQNVPTGCYVPIVAVATTSAGGVVSNTATLPVQKGGGECSDPQFGTTGGQLSLLTGPVKSGFLIVAQSTAPGMGTSNSAVAIFQQTSGVSSPGGGAIVSIGGCILIQTLTGGSTGTTTPLSAGTITVTGPGGSAVTLMGIPQLPGFYAATLASIPSTGGAYVFNSTAGSQVGAFSGVIVNSPNPLLVWANQNAAANVARSQGLAVSWNGGSPGSYVIISGSSASGTANGSFTCYVPQSALQFTVPPYILLGMPAGTGTVTVQNSTNLTTFSASGLDFGGALGSVSFQVNSNYN
jgi:uncharacterized protein (TIGR03437 family)